MPIISVFSQQKCTSSCVLPYKEMISQLSTVSDKNELGDVNFRKFTGVIVVFCFDKNLKIKFCWEFYAQNNVMNESICKVSAYTRLVHIQNYFYFFIG